MFFLARGSWANVPLCGNPAHFSMRYGFATVCFMAECDCPGALQSVVEDYAFKVRRVGSTRAESLWSLVTS